MVLLVGRSLAAVTEAGNDERLECFFRVRGDLRFLAGVSGDARLGFFFRVAGDSGF
jgi:hypothetical protein